MEVRVLHTKVPSFVGLFGSVQAQKKWRGGNFCFSGVLNCTTCPKKQGLMLSQKFLECPKTGEGTVLIVLFVT